MNEKETEKVINSSLKVSDEVIAEIISNAAMEVDGVAAVAKAKKNPIKTVMKDKRKLDIRTELAGDVLEIYVGIIIKSDAKAVATAEAVQNKIKSSVQNMLNLTVTKVNVNITDCEEENKD